MEESCALMIKQINDALEKQANNALRSLDLTMVQVAVLLRLNEMSDKQASLKDLERFLRVAQSTTVGIVRRLEQKGLVVGFGDANDKRIKMVRITAQGERCCAASKANMDATEEMLLSSLSKEEQKLLKALLYKVNSSIQ